MNTTRVLATMTATLTLLIAPAMAPAIAAPAVAAPSTAAPGTAATDRSLHLQGAPNARTFAGYRVADGRAVSATLVVRSDNLSSITPQDVSTLQALPLRSVVDLRTGIERVIQPDKPVPGAQPQWFDVLGATPPTTLIDLPSAYRAFVTDPGARAAFAHTLLELKSEAAQGKATLFHCSAGKDRTGWAAAVLLTILGVDRTTVETDYLDSNHYRHAGPNDPINGVNIEWLRTSFRTADQMYGSFENYVSRGLGLTAADIAALKSELLVPAPGK